MPPMRRRAFWQLLVRWLTSGDSRKPSVARLQRWRTVGEGPPYLKIVGKVLYRLKDIEAYEEASLVRKVF